VAVSATRRLATIPIIGAALGLLAFGIVRGATHAGPAHGTRLIVAIDPPLDPAVFELAAHVARARLDDGGSEVRVVSAGNRFVIELGEDDRELVDHAVAILERTAHLEIQSSDHTVLLEGRAIRRAEVVADGVAIEVVDPSALAKLSAGQSIAFVLDSKVMFTGVPDRVAGTSLHVPTPGATEEAAIRTAINLVAVIEAGAAHPMHIVKRDAFVRATGFLARAWPFLAIAAVLLLVAAFVWRKR
jgi:hypothetical protein